MAQPSRQDLLARYRTIGADGPAVPAPPPVISPVHREVVGMVEELIEALGDNAGPYTTLITVFKRLQPMLLRDFAKTTPEQVEQMAHLFGRRMLAIGRGGEPGESLADAGTASARLDLAQGS